MLIHTQNLARHFNTDGVITKALQDASFDIDKGEFLAIMGSSGSGKSTLMHVLGFLDRATDGVYEFNNQNVSGYSDDELARLRNEEIGFIFQSFNLLKKTTVFENIMLPLIYSTKIKTKKERVKRVHEIIEDVGLSHRTYHLSNQLSGGEKQRVAIARALINYPQVIFADEPTGNLDSKTGIQIMDILQELNEKGNTIILVTHETYTAQHTKRIITLKDGLLISDEPVLKRIKAKEINVLK